MSSPSTTSLCDDEALAKIDLLYAAGYRLEVCGCQQKELQADNRVDDGVLNDAGLGRRLDH